MTNHAVSHVRHEHIKIIPLKEKIKSAIGIARVNKRPFCHARKAFWQSILFQSEVQEPLNSMKNSHLKW